MIPQTCPGTLQLANKLCAGMTGESVAYAKMSYAMNEYGNNMTGAAEQQLKYGKEIETLSNWMVVVQTILSFAVVAAPVAVGAASLVGGASAADAGAAAANALNTTGSIAANGGIRAFQGLASTVQGGMLFYKSDLDAKTQRVSTQISSVEKISETDVNIIKAETEGAGKVGSGINEMLINTGAAGKRS
jgi:hypothetical protein